jgi:hypothetical protein
MSDSNQQVTKDISHFIETQAGNDLFRTKTSIALTLSGRHSLYDNGTQ